MKAATKPPRSDPWRYEKRPTEREKLLLRRARGVSPAGQFIWKLSKFRRSCRTRAPRPGNPLSRARHRAGGVLPREVPIYLRGRRSCAARVPSRSMTAADPLFSSLLTLAASRSSAGSSRVAVSDIFTGFVGPAGYLWALRESSPDSEMLVGAERKRHLYLDL